MFATSLSGAYSMSDSLLPLANPSVHPSFTCCALVLRTSLPVASLRVRVASIRLVSTRLALQGCMDALATELLLKALSMMLSRGIAPNRNTYRILATTLPAEAGVSAPQSARASLGFLMKVVDVFDTFGRRAPGRSQQVVCW